MPFLKLLQINLSGYQEYNKIKSQLACSFVPTLKCLDYSSVMLVAICQDAQILDGRFEFVRPAMRELLELFQIKPGYRVHMFMRHGTKKMSEKAGECDESNCAWRNRRYIFQVERADSKLCDRFRTSL